MDVEDVRIMSHEEKIQMLRDMKINYEVMTEHLKELLAWFLKEMGK